jgi:predicted nucleic acid-binding protein
MNGRVPKNTPFMAIAMQLGVTLWSNDKHFRDLGQIPVYTTESLIEFLIDKDIWW